MPTRICPHCGDKFAKVSVLDTHIRYVHPSPGTQLPESAPLATLPASSSTYPLAATQFSPTNNTLEHPIPVIPPTFTMNTFTPVNRPQPDPSSGPIQPTIFGSEPPSTPVRNFAIVFEAKGHHFTQRLLIPSTETFPQFLQRMANASARVAGKYILGRTTGFQESDEGGWKYSLVNRKTGMETPGGGLRSTLFYQAMISQLLKAKSEFNYALVWHDMQTSPSSLVGVPKLRAQQMLNEALPLLIGERSLQIQDGMANAPPVQGGRLILPARGWLRAGQRTALPRPSRKSPTRVRFRVDQQTTLPRPSPTTSTPNTPTRADPPIPTPPAQPVGPSAPTSLPAAPPRASSRSISSPYPMPTFTFAYHATAPSASHATAPSASHTTPIFTTPLPPRSSWTPLEIAARQDPPPRPSPRSISSSNPTPTSTSASHATPTSTSASHATPTSASASASHTTPIFTMPLPPRSSWRPVDIVARRVEAGHEWYLVRFRGDVADSWEAGFRLRQEGYEWLIKDWENT